MVLLYRSVQIPKIPFFELLLRIISIISSSSRILQLKDLFVKINELMYYSI